MKTNINNISKKYFSMAFFMKNTISIFLVILTILFTFSFKHLYYFDIDFLNIDLYSNFSKEILIRNYNYIIDFTMSFKDSTFDIPDFPSSLYGKLHFIEVRNIIQILIKLSFVLLITSVIGAVSCYKKKYYKIFREVSIQIIVFPIVLLLPFLINFSKSFEIFHKILFRNDYWLFDNNTDPVIDILPEKYFFHVGILILVILCLLSVASYIIYYIFLHKNSNKKI
ncbi:TIGR01906 family membrane protein [Peptostreptococcus canis]|uniref:TIGR01906 family membrane protein n=1 Tax=Peptostreptococcus canis TaxID=1159213 RepID=A0ABR6TIU9_9FIRM|nr:TIGR01906 family membrane protein [Peptostreptococcus canis]MBC2575322.1 TIGR01906 family membrane protein [Peptostreptococcus canis]MBP1997495.1 integral membrane protein (TIGR01906 family) [Peptostreptococcus canis]